jgi:hypothetical protein
LHVINNFLLKRKDELWKEKKSFLMLRAWRWCCYVNRSLLCDNPESCHYLKPSFEISEESARFLIHFFLI